MESKSKSSKKENIQGRHLSGLRTCEHHLRKQYSSREKGKVMSTNFKHSIKVPTQYKRTAAILKEALESKKSLKNLIYEEKHARIPSLQKTLRLYADNRGAIDDAIEKSQVLVDNPRLTASLCKVLVTELLYGRRILNGESKPVQTIRSYKERLLEFINRDIDSTTSTATHKEATHKRVRYVRVNTNLISMEEATEYLKAEEFQKKNVASFESYTDFLSAVSDLGEYEYMVDMHLEDLLIFNVKTKQYWACNAYVAEKKFLLQDKAPSLAVEILQPRPGSTVLDMCAAPGMKTIMACNRMKNEGKLYAVELNPQRYQILSEMTQAAGCKIVEYINDDSLKIDSKKCPNVEFVIVDPSCSGSGMQRLSFESQQKDPERLKKLGYLQYRMLSHAMNGFPNVKRIVYSTCSLYEEENEQVIQECLEKNPHFKLLSGKKALRNKWKNFGDSKYKNIGKHCIYARPTEDITDGMFIALFERRNNNDNE